MVYRTWLAPYLILIEVDNQKAGSIKFAAKTTTDEGVTEVEPKNTKKKKEPKRLLFVDGSFTGHQNGARIILGTLDNI